MFFFLKVYVSFFLHFFSSFGLVCFLISRQTSRLLMVHQMGPSRVARFPGTERDSHNSSSDQDSESSSSAAPLPQVGYERKGSNLICESL